MASRARWQQTVKRGGRWREDDARQAQAAWRASGKTIAAFSDEHGLGKRLERWDRKLRGREQAMRCDESVALAPLIPVNVQGASSSSVAIVVTAEEVRLEVADPATVPSRWLGEMVLAMRGGHR
ncbi:MAG: hypothetical protein GY944_22575 [bacterium]|nr:hypothetical protein [bacterium]